MTTDVVARQDGALLERVLLTGDLSRLSPAERLAYYQRVCESLGLNPLTRPFEYLTLSGRLVLYARRDATDQLRALRRVSVTITSRERVGDVYLVTARAETPDGRTDESIGAVSLQGLQGEALANALMKAETKAKRRVTLSICGLGWLDETEIETVPDARRVPAEDVEALPPAPSDDAEALEALMREEEAARTATPPSSTPPPPSMPRQGAATERQIKAIWAIAGKRGLPRDQVHARARALFGTDELAALTVVQASALIQALSGEA